MNKTLITSILTLFLLFSCKDYSDLEILLKNENILLTENTVEVALTGKEKLKGVLKIKYNQEVIGETSIESFFDSKFTKVALDIGKLSKNQKISESELIDINLVFINEEEKIKINTPVRLKPIFPPVSKILSISGKNFERINLSKNEIDDLIIKKGKKLIEPIQNPESTKTYKDTDKIIVELEVDTLYKTHIIGRYPVASNSIYKEYNLESLIKESIKEGGEQLKSDFSKKMNTGNYVLRDTIDVSYSGDIGLYLINIDNSDNYFIQQFGILRGDNISPIFNNRTWCSFDGDKEVEGQVCFDVKDFYGHNPYNIPFVGKALGDIAYIYIDKKRVPFKIGEEIYFKKRIYLDGGYNRISVKIVDKNGNETKSFIPVTMESMDKPQIDIDNEINIEN